MLAELTEGYREVRSRAWLWVTVAVFALAVPLGYAPLYAAGPVAEATSTETVLVGGAILTAAVLSLGLVPRETRTLRRMSHQSRV